MPEGGQERLGVIRWFLLGEVVNPCLVQMHSQKRNESNAKEIARSGGG